MDDNQQQQMLMDVPPSECLAEPPLLPEEQQYSLTAAQKQYALMVLRQEQASRAARQKQDFNDKRSRVEDMLRPENKHAPVVINGLHEYMAMNAAYMSLSNRDDDDEEQVSMDGYPVTDADRAPLVAQLSAAIMDFSNIIDKPVKRQVVGGTTTVPSAAVRSIKALSPLEIQLLAWEIMCATCDAHCGRHNVPSWTNVFKYNSYSTFTERFRDVRHAVARCKALLKSILDTDIPFVKRLAAGPRAEYKMKGDNRDMNDKRAAEREESKKRKRMEDDVDHQDGEDEQQYVDSLGGQAPFPGYPHHQFPGEDYISETNATVGIPSEVSVQSKESVTYSQDGHINDRGEEVLDNPFHLVLVGDQAQGVDFVADQLGGVDGAPSNKFPMPLSVQHEHTFNQATAELNMGDIGGQAIGFPPTIGHHGVNTDMSSGPANQAGLRQSVDSLDG